MADELNTPRVAIVGAGYAGLAAAVELAAAGIAVDVFEASRSLGGRARAAEIEGITLDNGQHILVGAYRETLRLMRQVGADPETLLLRLPLRLSYPGVLRVAAPTWPKPWPAPLHLAAALLGAHGLNWREKLAAARLMQFLKGCRYRLKADMPMAELMDRLAQPPRLRRYFWDPLCIATLNTPVEYASAQIFANVLRDTLGAERAASDLLIPRVDLSALFPEPAAAWLQQRGISVQRGRRIEALAHDGRQFQLDGQGSYSHTILAVAPHHLAPLLPPGLEALREQLAQLSYEPIVTAWLQYPAKVQLPEPMIGYGDGLAQWIFDRGQLDGPAGLLAVVISAQGRHRELGNEALCAALHGELAGLIADLPSPLWSRVVTEKRATFACTPGQQRPAMRTAIPGLLLAGDHVASDYPATIESAIRSGIAAAREVIQGH
ncbi:MAG TPA: hydroxysqualene dehydroxylase HpnE [Rhodocyclaceae bacterium]